MALFIGGPLDGRLIEVEPTRTWVEVGVEKSETLKPDIKSSTDIFYYKREILSCPTMQIPVFVPRSYKCEDVMNSLIRGYHQSVQQ